MKKIKLVNVLIVLALAASLWSQQTEKNLSLNDCIVGALKNNLGLAVEVFNPQLADISVTQAKEKFVPSIYLGFNKQETNQPSFSWIEAGDQVQEQFRDIFGQLTQEIPTGGNFRLTLYSYETETTAKFQTINPRFGSQLRFDFTQPLLKDFGFKVSQREIIIAKNNTAISEIQLKQTLLDTVYNVEEAYWNYVGSIEYYKVMEQSLKLAQDLLAKNTREVEVGMLAPIEVLTAKSEVARREADILQAESMIKGTQDRLKTILNLSAKEDIDLTKIVPTDTPTFEERDVSLEEALAMGLQMRPDLQAIRVDMKNRDLDLSFAKNQLLPELNFQASLWSPGLSGTQLIYENDDPINGEIIGEIPGKFSDALRDAFKFKYKNWNFGLTLSIPITSIITRAQYAQAKVSLEQAQVSLQNQEQQAFLEIRDAVRDVQISYKQVQAYKLARELAQEKLEAEQKKLKVGLATNYEVLLHQRDLADAQSSELRAVIDYNLALAALDRALGTTLEKKNIKMTEIWSSTD
ncbi:MAG: TolC family protein [Candidatus Aminicenantes bacterium]|nr:MAG: TolC family protein [Candidatus Aminicenantes bacterium]